MEVLYQICLTAIITIGGLILWACGSVLNRPFFRWSFQTLAILLALFLITKYVWIGFSLREIIVFVFYNVAGWGLLLGVGYIMMIISLAYGDYKKALKDIEDLKEQNLAKEKAIGKLYDAVEKLGAPIPRDRVKIY